MGVVIRLQRGGNRNRPFFRVVVMDSRKQRDSAFLEKVGYYDPVPDPDLLFLDTDRIAHWMHQGAKPSVSVRSLMKRVEKEGNRRAPTAGTAGTSTDLQAVEPASPTATQSDPSPAGQSAPTEALESQP